MRWHCFFTVNSSVNAARSYWTNLLAEVLAEVPRITHEVKEFWRNLPSWCSGKVKSHLAEGSGFKSCFVPFFLSFFFSRFWLVLFAYLLCCFSINMYLNNCYLIKCNKKKRKVLCFQRKDSILNILYMDKQSEFLSFPTIYCGKPRVDNHFIVF